MSATPPANDNAVRTDLERAIGECPGPMSGDPWWQRRRHLTMMEYGTMRAADGRPIWPAAAEYVRHQNEMDRFLP
jgi:hypothetical protein